MKKSGQWLWFITGSALGATVMWFLDPRSGTRRRAQVRDKVTHLSHACTAAILRALRHSRHRIIGFQARRHQNLIGPVDDDKLTSRVRSEFGRKIRHARAIQSRVISGVVTLSGSIFKDEVEALLSCVEQVPGVRGIINKLEIHEVPSGQPH